MLEVHEKLKLKIENKHKEEINKQKSINKQMLEVHKNSLADMENKGKEIKNQNEMFVM